MRYPSKSIVLATLVVCPSVAAPIAAVVAADLSKPGVKWNPVWEVFGLAFQFMNTGANFGENTVETSIRRPVSPIYGKGNKTNNTSATPVARGFEEYVFEQDIDNKMLLAVENIKEDELDHEVLKPERHFVNHSVLYQLGSLLRLHSVFAKYYEKWRLSQRLASLGWEWAK